MDPGLYRSVQECDLVSFHDIQYDQNQLHKQLDGNKNNLLHVCAQFHDSAAFVKEILDKTQSYKEGKLFMLMGKNLERETALHIASRNGRSNTVLVLIESAKALDLEYQYEELESGAVKIAEEMMRATNKNGDTALHLAVRNNDAEVARLLVIHDPHFKHPANTIKETPLYLAVEGYNQEIMNLILTICTSQNYEGPGGKTALHAAVLSINPTVVERILQENPALTRRADESGWIPLHYAAYFGYFGFGLLQLLNADRPTVYMPTRKDDNRTALHIAACSGKLETMQGLLEHCPDSWNMVTSKGQNLLHLVVETKAETFETKVGTFSGYERSTILKFILDQKWAMNLINQKDAEGNTPLHLYAKRATEDPVVDFDVSRLVKHPLLYQKAVNNQNFTPLDVMLTSGNFAKGLTTEKQDNAFMEFYEASVGWWSREPTIATQCVNAYNERKEANRKRTAEGGKKNT